MSARQRRDQRRPGVRVVLTPRDHALLAALGRFRIAESSQLAALFFAGVRRDTAQARLRRLFDSGYLDVRSGSLNEESRYVLGPEGRRLLEADGIAVGSAPNAGATHHLAVVSAWVTLAVALHDAADLRLESFRPDWELRREHAGLGLSVVPDALVALSWAGAARGRERLTFALEVDRGTERPVELRRKLVAYGSLGSALAQPGGSPGLVLVLEAASRTRATVIGELVCEHWRGWSQVCLAAEWPSAFLHAVKASAGTPPADSPCGTGSLQTASAFVTSGMRSRGEVSSP